MAGKWFDELQVGDVFRHPIRRTLTETDNVLFSAMTHNPAQLHLDEEYCRTQTEFGQRIVNSAFTLGLMVRISVGETALGTAVANLGWDDVRFPKPLFHGDTIRIESEVIELRESRSRPDQGIVTFLHRAYNQKDELVAQCVVRAFSTRRSWRFIPGNSDKKLGKADGAGADALILDLEDAVVPDWKGEVRGKVAAFLHDRPRGARGGVLLVRINPLDSGMALDDLIAIAVPAFRTDLTDQ